MYNSITNIVVVVFLLLYLRNRNSVSNCIIAILLYLSLHYAFALLISFYEGWSHPNIIFHTVGTPLSVKVLGGGFLLFCVSLILYKVRRELIPVILKHKKIILIFSFLLLLFLFQSILNLLGFEITKIQQGLSTANYVHIFTSALLWFLAIFIALSLIASKDKLLKYKVDIINSILILVIIQVFFGIYEVASGVAYHATAISSYRAAGTLFNPNILGIWGAGIALIVCYLYYMKHVKLRVLVFLLFMLSLIYILSSSRSGLIACFVGMFIALILIRTDAENHKMSFGYKILPISLMFVSLISLISIIKIAALFITNGLVRTLSELSDRIIYLIPDISIYLFRTMLNKIEASKWYTDMIARNAEGGSAEGASALSETNIEIFEFFGRATEKLESLSPSLSVKESIQGRLSGGAGNAADNTYVYLQTIAGIPSLFFWLLIFVFAIWLGVNKYRRTPDLTTVYTLSYMALLLFSGLIMRSTQLFPVWIYFAVFLGISLYWWIDTSQDDNDTNLSGS